MKTPQIILICIYAIALLLHAHEHGKPKEGKNNFWYSFISTAIIFLLLTWGGFFN